MRDTNRTASHPMKERLHHSLIYRTGLTLAAIVLLALVSIVTSVVVADRMEGDAEAINTGGSLRWKAYRIGVLVHSPREVLDAAIADFDHRLGSPVLRRTVAINRQDSLQSSWQRINEHWVTGMRPLIASDPPRKDPFLTNVDQFITEVDQFVMELQHSSENKVRTLRIVQGITVFLTLALVFAAMFGLHADVIVPLAGLIEAARAAGRGDFSVRVQHVDDKDELGVLGQSFNTMADNLSRLYAEMEERVQAKTRELQRNNNALDMLYRVSRMILAEPDQVRSRLPEALGMIGRTLSVHPVFHDNTSGGGPDLRIVTPEGEFAAEAFPGGPDGVTPGDTGPGQAITLPVEIQQRRFGTLLIISQGSELEPWAEQVLRSVTDVLATALSLAEREQDKRRLLLMEERAVIARELHDSLAQSLSYQKIQVSRLETLINRGADRQEVIAALDDLRDGLNSAYRQLRELLTTFRLRIEGRGFGIAVNAAVEEFMARGIDIRLDFRIAHCALAANEEIHALQVVREALSNVVRHAQATSALVSLRQRADGRVEVVIEDDGIGMPAQTAKRQHHGLVIIRERAATLGGRVSWEPVQPRGTRLILEFRPAYLNT